MTVSLNSLPCTDHCSILGSTCSLFDLEVGASLSTYIMAAHASTGLHLRNVWLQQHRQHSSSFEPVRVNNLNMDLVGQTFVDLLLKAHKLRHLIMRDIADLDWIFVVAELWPVFAQLHTLELDCSKKILGSGKTVERARRAEDVPLYRAAARIRATIRLRWLSVGQRDLQPDDIKQLAEVPNLAAAKAWILLVRRLLRHSKRRVGRSGFVCSSRKQMTISASESDLRARIQRKAAEMREVPHSASHHVKSLYNLSLFNKSCRSDIDTCQWCCGRSKSID